MKEQCMFGLWSSPITPDSLASSLRLSDPRWDSDGRTLAWVEGRSDRGVIVVQEDGGAPRDLTPGDMSVRAFVGYGGGDFAIHEGTVYFVGQADQRIYRQALAGGAPRPITPAFGAASSPAISPDGRWLVFIHSYEDVDCLAIVDTDGALWPAKLATGRDFYMQPAWHPAGDRLAWIEWDHPQMPWDGSELRLARVITPPGDLPALGPPELIAGDADTSIFQPEFTPRGDLLYISDAAYEGQRAGESRRGGLYRYDLEARAVSSRCHVAGDFGAPAWGYGMRRFAVMEDGAAVAVAVENGFERLYLVDALGEATDLSGAHAGYSTLTNPSVHGQRVALAASGGTQPARVITIDVRPNIGAPQVIRRADPETVPAAALSQPEAVSWTSFDGELAHGIYYPPASDRFEGSEPAPLVVAVHGGPTTQVKAGWDPTAQFFATRGYGFLHPNYRGSTGYGRDYMLKLRNSWGIYDVRDAKTGAEWLVREGRADSSKLVIMGGSAGGLTVLQSLIEYPAFYRAALCMYGVTNHFTLAADTHKFEARYLDSLLGRLPEAAHVYRERSPIFHLEGIKDPVAVFQGDIDRVVPRSQSDALVASLRARGVPHEYHVYEGEGHGWRKTETIRSFWTTVERFLREYVLYS